MKHKTIRMGVWESNSSSSHSLSISTYETLVYPYWNKEKTLYLTQGEFGWEYAVYSDVWSKVKYAYTLAKGWQDSVPKYLEMLLEVLSTIPNVGLILEDDSVDGYVDHESMDLAEDIFYSKNTLASFLFCSTSKVITDNDNH